MSCYWDIEFSAIGAIDRVKELERTLPLLKCDDDYWKELLGKLPFRNKPSLFHHVEVHQSGPGFVGIHACRNYYGNEAMAELIARFGDLTFHGVISTDAQDECYTLFEGRDGEMTVEYCENTHREADIASQGEPA